MLVQAISIAAYLKVNELREFYALAVIFGVAYGGGMPLYASLARDYFGQRIMGTVFGAATMLSSLGMSIGPVAGGWVFDTYNNYAWLYIASAAVAVGAVLLATTFPKPVPVRMAVREFREGTVVIASLLTLDCLWHSWPLFVVLAQR